ncbi:MAG: carboxypeptidase regulatory-like domain-containing protein [Planctomycetes bacterium]|nr:carboxypeptidase regulatory-like domain-containing protein [Planctomycetota bacterium]
MRKLLRLFGFTRAAEGGKKRGGQKARRPAHFQPWLEVLECRLVPSPITAGALVKGGKPHNPPAKVKASLGNGGSDYPFLSSNPLTSVAFSESDVLRAAKLDAAQGTFEVWYNDEHALALGVGQVIVKTAAGTTTTNYPITALTSDPGVALNPDVGATAGTGAQAGTDVSGRPMAPSLFITDITDNPNNRSGDWQCGGTAFAPSAVFGTWKSFTETVDSTRSPARVTLSTSRDPAKNGWNLGAGSDAPPPGLQNEGYGAEVRWNLDELYQQGVLTTGHTYRFYVMVHDGDQNKAGGDAGQASYDYYYPGPAHPVTPPPGLASLAGTVFKDTNRDGVQDNGELGFSGVMLTLTDSSGKVVATTSTDSNGQFIFKDVPAGSYSLSVASPAGFRTNGAATVGTVKGNPDGTPLGGAEIDSITLRGGDAGTGYTFAMLKYFAT